jgi:excisionase family DNA binding protein
MSQLTSSPFTPSTFTSPPAAPEADPVISLPEAARLLGIGATTLKRWCGSGQVPHVRTPGGHRRFSRNAIVTFAASLERRIPGQENGAGAWYEPHPDRWLECGARLCDPQRMESALLATRARHADWGRAADAIVNGFLAPAARSEGVDVTLLPSLRRSLAHAVASVSGHMHARATAPVVAVVETGGPWTGAMSALALVVLREAGLCVLDAGSLLDGEAVLGSFLLRQAPNHVLGVAGPLPEAGDDLAIRRLTAWATASGCPTHWLLPGRADASAFRAYPDFARMHDAAGRWAAETEAVA